MDNGILSPRSDLIFKLLFGDERNIELLTDFLKSVLDLPADEYEEVSVVDPHLLPDFQGDKLGVLDVKVRTRSKKIIDVEIQIKPNSELRERVVYYSAKMVTEQVGAGDSYINIKRVISIIITDFVFVPENDVYHNRYTFRDAKTGSEFTDLIEINTLELAKLPPSEDGTKLWNWMKFLSADSKEEFAMIAEKSPEVKKAVVRLIELSNDERARLLFESRQKMEWDIAAGKRDARAEGRALARSEIVKNAFQMKMSVDDIITLTGLPREEIEHLRNTY